MADQNGRKYRPPIMKRVGGIFLLAIGLVVLAFTLYFALQDLPLWVFGKHIKAEVIEVWVERADEAQLKEEGEFKFDFFVRYQFTTSSGKTIIKTAEASVTEWSGMWEGLLIDVVYFPLFPQLNRLDDSRWILFLSCTYIPLIVVSIIGLKVGWYMLTSP